MNTKRIFYRRKAGGIVIEGKCKGKGVLIWTLPRDPIKLLSFLIEASYFPKEKQANISQKINSLDSKSKKRTKGSPKVRTTNLIRNSKNDYDKEVEEEEEFDSPDELSKELGE